MAWIERVVHTFFRLRRLVLGTIARIFSIAMSCVMRYRHRRLAGYDNRVGCLQKSMSSLVKNFEGQLLNKRSDFTVNEDKRHQCKCTWKKWKEKGWDTFCILVVYHLVCHLYRRLEGMWCHSFSCSLGLLNVKSWLGPCNRTDGLSSGKRRWKAWIWMGCLQWCNTTELGVRSSRIEHDRLELGFFDR